MPRDLADDRNKARCLVERVPTRAVVFVILVLLALPRRAHAYIDPGTGSYVIQVVVSLFLGVMFILRRYWKKIWDYVSCRLGKHDQ